MDFFQVFGQIYYYSKPAPSAGPVFRNLSTISILSYYAILQNIYQLFYMEGSSREKGTLSQLRNEVNRRDVSGADAVTKAFR